MAAVTGDECVQLYEKYVMYEDEHVVSAFGGPDGRELFVQTNHGSSIIRVLPDFLRIGQASWVRAVVVVEDDNISAAGMPMTDALVVCHDGAVLHVNQEAVVAELGKRLHEDLDPIAYGQILVRYHPWTSAYADVITDSDGFRREFGYPDIPDSTLPRLTRQDQAIRLSFHSGGVYQHGRASARMLKITEWEVDAWPDRPARWRSTPVDRDILLDRPKRPGKAGR